MYLQSELLSAIPRLTHGFGTYHEPIPQPLIGAWELTRPKWKQVHGTSFTQVTGPTQNCGDVDALYSRKLGIPIAVMTADCVPILLARRDGQAVAAVHAGWRGTQARILENLWTKLSHEGEIASEWIAAIGPAIGPCCYEVSSELAEQFAREFAELGIGLAVPKVRHLDLPAINARILSHLGLPQIDLIRACTRCSISTDGTAEFHSFRREGGGTRQYSGVQIGSPPCF